METLEVVEKPLTNNHVQLSGAGVDLKPVDDFIFEKVQDAIEGLEEGERLVILMSEMHAVPTTILPQVSLIRNLAGYINPEEAEDTVPFIVGQESSYIDSAITALDMIDKLQNLRDVNFFDRFAAHDPFNWSLLAARRAQNRLGYAPHSAKKFFRACTGSNVPVLGCDACGNYSDYLVAYDELSVRIAMEDFGVDLSEEQVSASAEYDGNNVGMRIRNRVMAERIQSYMDEWQAPIMVVPMGLGHLYGKKPEGISYEDSVVSLLEESGCKTLVVNLLPLGQREALDELVPADILKKHPDHIVIEDLCPARFVDPDYMQERYGEPPEELEKEGIYSAEFERDYIYGTLLNAYSGEDCPFDFEADMPDMDVLKDILLSMYEQAEAALSQEERCLFLMP